MSQKTILNQLKKLNVNKLKLENGQSVASELKRHAAILADCIMEELDKVYDSYEPRVYKRTYGLYDALCIEDTPVVEVKSDGGTLSIHLKFDDGATSQGLWGQPGDKVTLINEGQQTHGRFSSVPMLGYRDGTHFVEKAIMKYKQKVRNPFPIKWTNEYFERDF